MAKYVKFAWLVMYMLQRDGPTPDKNCGRVCHSKDDGVAGRQAGL